MTALQRSTSLLGLIGLLACESGGGRTDPNGGADGADGWWTEGCEQWGPIGIPWAPGTYALGSYGYQSVGPYLLGTADAVELVSPSGKTVACSVTTRYRCKSPSGGGTITASLRGQHWSWEARCPYYEDGIQLNLDGANPCVEAGTVVLEGDLVGVDLVRATASVILEGPWQHFVDSADPHVSGEEASAGHLPAIQCSVHEGHYTCPTLGFETTLKHTLVVGGVRTEVELPVSDCSATKATLDVTCPTPPLGFYVELPERASFGKVEATYEGGAPQPCVLVPPQTIRIEGRGDASVTTRGANSRFLCPPAIGDEWGRGHYQIIAAPPSTSTSGASFATNVTDVFDGCGGTAAPIRLRRVGSPE